MNFYQTLAIGAIAALLGFYLQHRAWRHQYFVRLRDEEKSAASNLAQQIFDRIDRRIAAQRRFLRKALAVSKNQTQSDDNSFYLILDDWNGDYSSTLASLRAIFGNDMASNFEREVHDRLRQNSDIAARVIRLGYENLSSEHRKQTDSLYEDLAVQCYHVRKWMREINELIEAGQFGRSQFINSIEANDPELLTHAFLIKRLLNFPRTNSRA